MEKKNLNPQYTLLTYPHPNLLTKCESVDIITDEDKYTIQEMIRICKESKGYALAANQIGYMRRIVVMVPQEEDSWVVMINPTYEPHDERKSIPSDFTEGCLSFPGIRIPTPRHEFVKVICMDESGKQRKYYFSGIPSIAVQHECEHLDGKTFIDGLSKLKQNRIKAKMKKMRALK